MDLARHDNYQILYKDGDEVKTGARSNKRLSMIPWRRVLDNRVLDIGCNAGMLSREAKRKGAKYVLGVERHDVVNIAADLAKQEELDVDFRQMDIESEEFKTLVRKGFDIVFFCAMYSHVKPENRANYLRFLDRNINEAMFYETNFEGKVEAHLDVIKKYTTFDEVRFIGQSGDRKPEDYNLFILARHRNHPREVDYLPIVNMDLSDIKFETGYYHYTGDKKKEEEARIKKLMDSIKLNGQARPILVYDDNGTLRVKEGGHRYIAMKELNRPYINVRDVTDWMNRWRNPYL